MRSAKIVSRVEYGLSYGTAKQASTAVDYRIVISTCMNIVTCNFCGLYVKFIWFY